MPFELNRTQRYAFIAKRRKKLQSWSDTDDYTEIICLEIFVILSKLEFVLFARLGLGQYSKQSHNS